MSDQPRKSRLHRGFRFVASHLATAYLGAGVAHGYLLSLSIPALNWFGILVYALLWPTFIYCAPLERECKPLDVLPMSVQALMFTFGAEDD